MKLISNIVLYLIVIKYVTYIYYIFVLLLLLDYKNIIILEYNSIYF